MALRLGHSKCVKTTNDRKSAALVIPVKRKNRILCNNTFQFELFSYQYLGEIVYNITV